MVTQTTGSKLDSVLGYTLSWKDGSAWTGHHHLQPFPPIGDSMGLQKQKTGGFEPSSKHSIVPCRDGEQWKWTKGADDLS